MLTRNDYITFLEKRATYQEPAYDMDSQKAALEERKDNVGDSRTYLRSLFDNTEAAEKEQTKNVGKMFPGKGDKESGSILMKVAFFNAVRTMMEDKASGMSKVASPAYLAVVYNAFSTELEKIASFAPPAQAVASANQQMGNFKSLVHPTPAPSMTASIGKSLSKIPVGGALGKLR
jgi:hypothetical protein